METNLVNVEAGHAEVHNAETGRRIGTVSREKSGSLRTTVIWRAYTGNTQVGYGDTRSAAVAALVAHVEAKRAAAAAFAAKSR